MINLYLFAFTFCHKSNAFLISIARFYKNYAFFTNTESVYVFKTAGLGSGVHTPEIC